MIINLLAEYMDNSIYKSIQHIRQQHLNSGGDPADFPAYLKDQGVCMNGPFMQVDDQLAMLAKLQFN